MSYYSTNILSTNIPDAYYRTDETSGLVASDATTNHNNGALSGSITYSQPGAIAGDTDTSLGFSGSAALSVPYNTLNITTWTAISLEFWIKLTSGWQHVAITATTTTMLLYLNGVVVSPGSGSGDPIVVSQDMSFGGSYNSGDLDEIAVYPYVLTPTQIVKDYLIGAAQLSGGVALWANGSGTTQYDHLRAVLYPDPSVSLSSVGRAATSLVDWNANTPTNTSLSVKTSLDSGVTWSSVAAPGSAIPGIATQPDAVIDTFATNTSANYTQSNFGGTTGAWTWDTANSRLVGSGGNGGTLLNSTALTGADSLCAPDFDECDGSGVIANYIDANNLYYVQAWDASGSGTQNAVKLFKRASGTSTQLGSTATIDWPRGRFRRFILDVQAGTLTVSMDGIVLITVTDGAPLAAGKSGLLLGTLLRCIELRIQQYGEDVSELSVCTQLTLNTTDPTVTPQVLDLQAFVASADIDPGALIPTGKYLRTYLSDNINDLNTQSATTYSYVNPDNSVAFKQRTAVPAPWILDSANKTSNGLKRQGDLLVANLKLTPSGDLYRNRQILTGVQGTGTFTEARVGDGSTRTWNLSNPLAAAPIILLNGQQVLVGVKNVDTGKQYYYLPGSTAIDQDSSQTLLQEADTLSFPDYSGTFTTEVVRDNATPGTFAGTISQEELAAIDHTSGIVENVLDVSKMNLDVAAADAYGDQLLAQFGVLNARTLTFDTMRDGLLPGMDLTVYVPEQQCIGAHMLITQVGISAKIAPSVPGGVLYAYSVTATEGFALGSTWKLLDSLFKS